MTNSRYLKTLTDLNLTEHEAKVYLAALSLGPTTILQIARKSNVKRTTIYDVVEALKNKGLLRIEIDGFKKKYAAEDPRKLQEILERKKLDLNELIPSLRSLQKLPEGESILKYYEGLPAIKSVYNDLINSLEEDDEYYVIANQDYWYNRDKVFFQKFIEKRAEIARKKNVAIKLLFQDSALAQEQKKKEKEFFETIKILPPNIVFEADFVITPRRVIIHQVKGQDVAIVIENTAIIKTLQEVFKILWLTS